MRVVAPRPRSSKRTRRGGGGVEGGPPIGAALALGLVGVALIALLISALVLARGSPADSRTLCPAAGPSAVTAILVDATDALSPIQRAAVDTRLSRLIAGLRKDESVALYSLRPEGEPLRSIITLCRPSRPDETNPFTGNRRMAAERFDAVFQPKLRAALAAVMTGSPAKRSPIMAAIQAIAVSAFQSADAARPRRTPPLPKRLVIVSDMLENSQAGNHYAAPPDFVTFRQTAAYAHVRSHLEGVSVTLFYLRRDDGGAIQGRGHIDFWNAWFADQGASLDDVVAIEG